jgi:hypothetical protein
MGDGGSRLKAGLQNGECVMAGRRHSFGGNGTKRGERAGERKWRLGRVGAPAGWLGESGSGLPQSKAGFGLRALGTGF